MTDGVAEGLDPAALVAGEYDTRAFTLGEKTKSMLVGGKVTRVRQAHEKCIHLPNGATVRVSVDASRCATQIEEDDRLHAVARPKTYRLRLGEE